MARSGRMLQLWRLAACALALPLLSSCRLFRDEEKSEPAPHQEVASSAPAVLSPLPSWTFHGQHPAYPSHLYLTAVGAADFTGSIARTREESEQRARRNLVLTLRSRVKSGVQVDSRLRGRFSGEQSESEGTVSIDELTRVLGEEALEGSRIVERCEDPRSGAVYSLVALDTRVAAENLKQRIGEAASEAERLLGDADERLSRTSALKALLAAYDRSLLARVGRQTYRVLARDDPGGPADRGDEIRARLERILADLEVEVIEGQGQDGIAGIELPQPVLVRLVLRVDGSRQPVSGMTLLVRPRQPDAVRLSAESLRTDSEGTARFSVLPEKPTGRELNYIEVAADLGEGDLRAPSALVEFSLRSSGGRSPREELARQLVDRLRGKVSCLALMEAFPERGSGGERSDYGRYLVRRVGLEMANYGRFRVYEVKDEDLQNDEALRSAYEQEKVDAVLGGRYLDLGDEIDVALTVKRPYSAVLASVGAKLRLEPGERAMLIERRPKLPDPMVAQEIRDSPELERLRRNSEFYQLPGTDPQAQVEVRTREKEYFYWEDPSGNLYGGRRMKGEPLDLTVNSSRAGYLTIVAIDQEGGVTLVCPGPAEPTDSIQAGRRLNIPTEQRPRKRLRYSPPKGWVRFKAIVSAERLITAGVPSGQDLIPHLLSSLEGASFAEGHWEVQVKESEQPLAD
jgi:hypothetical protein